MKILRSLAIGLMFGIVAIEQDSAQSVAGSAAGGSSSLQGLVLPLPLKTGILGTKTPQALAEITALLQAASVSQLKDLQATGTMTYPAGDTHSATLLLSGSGYTRLDVQMESGVRSLRLQNASGFYQGENGKFGTLPPLTSTAGLFALPRIWSDAISGAQISLFDAGTSTVQGKPFHRISIEYPLGAGDPTSANPTAATDLYFDTSTHLLCYSVDQVSFSESHDQVFTRITGYGSYQTLSGILIPTTIKQSINGQQQWTLQIAQISLNTNPSPSAFHF